MTKIKKPKITRLTFTIDPAQGAAALLVGCQLAGKKLISMTRKGNKVVCKYVDDPLRTA